MHQNNRGPKISSPYMQKNHLTKPNMVIIYDKDTQEQASEIPQYDKGHLLETHR